MRKYIQNWQYSTSTVVRYYLGSVLRRACVLQYRPELEDFIDYMIDKGLSINTKLTYDQTCPSLFTFKERTCLTVSIRYQKSLEMVNFPLRRGVNVNVVDRRGRKALDYAITSGDQELIDAVTRAGGKKGSMVGGALAEIVAGATCEYEKWAFRFN